MSPGRRAGSALHCEKIPLRRDHDLEKKRKFEGKMPEMKEKRIDFSGAGRGKGNFVIRWKNLTK